MVSKASEDLPEPDSPVITTRLSRGRSTSMFLRLCSRAPRMRIDCMSVNLAFARCYCHGEQNMNLKRGGAVATSLALGLLLFGSCVASAAAAVDLAGIWRGTSWGESGRSLVEHFDGKATILQNPLIYGDSFTQVVLRDVEVGGVRLIAFFQMDRKTGGLKRIQLERQRHGVNPPAFRGVVAGLEAAFGAPDSSCAANPGAKNGFQAATELDWQRDDDLIRAIFRDTTVEAYEGCVTRDITTGPCGLTGQLLVRISPLGSDRASCPAPAPPLSYNGG